MSRVVPMRNDGHGCSVGGVTVERGKAEFSFGELLVLLDVEGAGPMSTPLPAAAEVAALGASVVRGTAPCVEVHGPCRFRTGLAHLYDPPRAELVVSPAYVFLSLTRFADVDIWKNMLDWVTSYLDDTLGPRGPVKDGHREYAGQGVVASVGHSRPSVRLDSRDMGLELGLRPDEPPLATVRRLLGLAADLDLHPPDDGNWRGLPTRWPMHLEGSRHGPTARFRFSAPHHDGQISTASLVEEWCWRWLDLCAGTELGHHDRTRIAWELGALGHAAIVRGDGAHRRDVHELHVPAAWLAR